MPTKTRSSKTESETMNEIGDGLLQLRETMRKMKADIKYAEDAATKAEAGCDVAVATQKVLVTLVERFLSRFEEHDCTYIGEYGDGSCASCSLLADARAFLSRIGESRVTDKPMTREEALAEAKRRWGRYGMARAGGDLKNPTFHVGRIPFGAFGMDVYGSGDSWEAAFADADARSR